MDDTFCKFEEHQDGLHKRTTPKNPLYLEVRGDSENFREIPGNSHLREEKGREQKGIGKEKEQEQEQEDERFADFWSEYPKKIAKNEAFKAWNKIKVDEILFMKIIQAIRLQRQSSAWLKDDGAYIPNPATWLNGKRWDDEVKKIKPTGAARFKQVLESGQFEQTGNYSDIDIDFEHIPEAGGG
ncbi:MAG: hypothetical protein H6Q67_2430 [Firmicutes bacterium]|nr:hypothetical protein [Bacillota bacterium]